MSGEETPKARRGDRGSVRDRRSKTGRTATRRSTSKPPNAAKSSKSVPKSESKSKARPRALSRARSSSPTRVNRPKSPTARRRTQSSSPRPSPVRAPSSPAKLASTAMAKKSSPSRSRRLLSRSNTMVSPRSKSPSKFPTSPVRRTRSSSPTRKKSPSRRRRKQDSKDNNDIPDFSKLTIDLSSTEVAVKPEANRDVATKPTTSSSAGKLRSRSTDKSKKTVRGKPASRIKAREKNQTSDMDISDDHNEQKFAAAAVMQVENQDGKRHPRDSGGPVGRVANQIEGRRAGIRWVIHFDCPFGHAAKRMKIVKGIESYEADEEEADMLDEEQLSSPPFQQQSSQDSGAAPAFNMQQPVNDTQQNPQRKLKGKNRPTGPAQNSKAHLFAFQGVDQSQAQTLSCEPSSSMPAASGPSHYPRSRRMGPKPIREPSSRKIIVEDAPAQTRGEGIVQAAVSDGPVSPKKKSRPLRFPGLDDRLIADPSLYEDDFQDCTVVPSINGNVSELSETNVDLGSVSYEFKSPFLGESNHGASADASRSPSHMADFANAKGRDDSSVEFIDDDDDDPSNFSDDDRPGTPPRTLRKLDACTTTTLLRHDMDEQSIDVMNVFRSTHSSKLGSSFDDLSPSSGHHPPELNVLPENAQVKVGELYLRSSKDKDGGKEFESSTRHNVPKGARPSLAKTPSSHRRSQRFVMEGASSHKRSPHILPNNSASGSTLPAQPSDSRLMAGMTLGSTPSAALPPKSMSELASGFANAFGLDKAPALGVPKPFLSDKFLNSVSTLGSSENESTIHSRSSNFIQFHVGESEDHVNVLKVGEDIKSSHTRRMVAIAMDDDEDSEQAEDVSDPDGSEDDFNESRRSAKSPVKNLSLKRKPSFAARIMKKQTSLLKKKESVRRSKSDLSDTGHSSSDPPAQKKKKKGIFGNRSSSNFTRSSMQSFASSYEFGDFQDDSTIGSDLEDGECHVNTDDDVY